MRIATANAICSLALFVAAAAAQTTSATDPLPSWNDGRTKQEIISFVGRVTDQNSPDYVPPPERIATFDNDGTLWSEKPVYFQLQFAIDRVKQLAPNHPEWRDRLPFKAVLEDNHQALAAEGIEGVVKLIMASHAGITTDEFELVSKEWLRNARHPRFKRPYTELVFQPMLELLDYLRAKGFKTYIVSGGGIEFLRVFAEQVYGVPPDQVLGSSIKTKYEVRAGKPVLVRLPELNFIDDKEGKPIGINQHIGRRPILAAGNSDGDFQMLEWTTSGPGSRFGLLVHHDDDRREWAYDRQSHVGKLDRALDEAANRGWTVISMTKDWKVIHPK